jgi:hypothetical protein
MLLMLVCSTLWAQSPPTVSITSNGVPVAAWGTLYASAGDSIASLGLELTVNDADGGTATILTEVVNTVTNQIATAELGLDWTEWSAVNQPVSYTLAPATGSFPTSAAGLIYAVWIQVGDGTHTVYSGFKIWLDAPSAPPTINATRGGVVVVNTSTLAVPMGTSLASLGLEFTVDDPAGLDVTLSGSITDAAASGLVASEFSSAAAATPYVITPTTGTFTQAGTTHEIRLWAQNTSGVKHLYALNIVVVDYVLEVKADGVMTASGEAAAGTARDFGQAIVGTLLAGALVVEVGNAGSMPMTLGAPTVAGDASDFVLDVSGWATTLAPGSKATFTVRFDPQAVGARAAAISFAYGSGAGFDLLVAGEGVSSASTPTPPGFSAGPMGGGGGGCAAGATSGPWWLLLPLLALLRKRCRQPFQLKWLHMT